MSHNDYQLSKKIAAEDYPFRALVMAAARKADTDNLSLIESVFPDIVKELRDRYNSPGGFLSDDEYEQFEEYGVVY